MIGTLLANRYRIVGEIASTPAGTLYRAEQSGVMDRIVSIKLMEAPSDSPQTVRFLREARVLSKLRHPATLRLVDTGREGDRLFLVMEEPLGELMTTWLETRRSPNERGVISLGSDLAGALAEAHELGVIHRGVNPDSVFIRPENADLRAQLFDFGTVHLLDATRVSLRQEVHGTAGFVAPEVIRGDPFDARADLYSLGVVLFESIEGRHPFDKTKGPVSLLMQHLESPFPHLSRGSRELDSVVQTLCARSPADRPKNAQEVRSRLEALRVARSSELSDFGSDVSQEKTVEESEDEVATLRPPRPPSSTTGFDDAPTLRPPPKSATQAPSPVVLQPSRSLDMKEPQRWGDDPASTALTVSKPAWPWQVTVLAILLAGVAFALGVWWDG